MRKTGNLISSGDIAISPIDGREAPACKYCDYKSICGFNMGGCENKYNYIDKKSKQEILDKIRNETEG